MILLSVPKQNSRRAANPELILVSNFQESSAILNFSRLHIVASKLAMSAPETIPSHDSKASKFIPTDLMD